jgi:hypothetical protein
MVDKWIRARTKHIKWDNGYRWAHTDSMNFGHCLGHIDELNKVA